MITIVVAMTKKRVIGKDNQLPWHIPDDLKNFKRLTEGKTLIMGENTFYSIGKPLPNRNTVVLSATKKYIEGVDVCNSMEEALEKAKSYGKEIIIAGGAMVYEQMLPLADRMIISHMKKDYEGDRFFPEFDEKDWEIEKREDFPEFEVVYYKRKRKE